jgi:alpha-ketoglutarate-dependent taurine dioxygenase
MKPLTPHFGTIVEHGPDTRSAASVPETLSGLLEERRCVILRGFGFSVDDFAQITSAITGDFGTYQGGGFTTGPFSRSTVNNDKTILTATGSTQDFPMSLHGEMYYLKDPPEMIWFFCETGVPEGGETTVGDGVQIFRDLPEGIRKRFLEQKVCYRRRLAAADWPVTFQTEDKSGAERFCQSKSLELQWEEDGSAVTRYYASAVRQTAQGEPAFINSVLLLALGEQAILSGQVAKISPEAASIKADFVVRWEDESPLGEETIRQINKACTRNEVALPWQSGDIVAVDNRSVMHGRRGTTAKGRKILVRMGNFMPQPATPQPATV